MVCEGCGKEVGDIKALRTHRKSCAKYAAWNAPFAKRPRSDPPPPEHTYNSRTLPRLF